MLMTAYVNNDWLASASITCTGRSRKGRVNYFSGVNIFVSHPLFTIITKDNLNAF